MPASRTDAEYQVFRVFGSLIFNRSQNFAADSRPHGTIAGPMSNLTQAPINLQVDTNLAGANLAGLSHTIRDGTVGF